MKNHNTKRIAGSFPGVILFLIALAIRFVFSLSPQVFETVYFQGAYPIICRIQSFFSFLWILPGYGLMMIAALIWLVWRFPKSKNFKRFFQRLLNLAGGTAGVFLILWGFNYVDKGLAVRMELPEVAEKIDISRHYLAVMDTAMLHRGRIDEKFETIVEVENLPTDAQITQWVKNTLRSYDYPAVSSVRVQHIKPQGSLLRMSIAGIYNPFTGEANVDAALTSLPLIFTTAHEIAHAYGVTSEAEANFVAFLACKSSENPLAEYAAFYALWRQIATEINKTYTLEERNLLANQIPQKLLSDRIAIYEAQNKHKAYFPELSYAMNDAYLKVQGVEKGIADYDEFLQLYFRWRGMKYNDN